jgi:hypothetical protein
MNVVGGQQRYGKWTVNCCTNVAPSTVVLRTIAWGMACTRRQIKDGVIPGPFPKSSTDRW